MKKKPISQEGIALIATLLLVTIILSMAITLSAVFIPKISSVTQIRQSVAAAYAAESGLEWCLYVNRIGPIPSPVMQNNTKYSVVPNPCLIPNPRPIPFVVKSTGSDVNDKVVRAFEASF